jgi:hypothetical protein
VLLVVGGAMKYNSNNNTTTTTTTTTQQHNNSTHSYQKPLKPNKETLSALCHTRTHERKQTLL